MTKPGLCVLITGGMCSGKSTLARNLIQAHGGFGQILADCIITADGQMTFAGKNYHRGTQTPGTDRLEKGENLEIARRCRTPVFVSEGFKVSTFGVVPLEIIFTFAKQLVIHLMADVRTIDARRIKRQGRHTSKKHFEKASNSYRAAQKFASIGVPVCVIDTRDKTPEEITEIAQKAIDEALL